MNKDLWTEEYFIDLIERKIKNEIQMKYFVKENRKPTKQEYEDTFTDWVSKIKCTICNYDLGIFDE